MAYVPIHDIRFDQPTHLDLTQPTHQKKWGINMSFLKRYLRQHRQQQKVTTNSQPVVIQPSVAPIADASELLARFKH